MKFFVNRVVCFLLLILYQGDRLYLNQIIIIYNYQFIKDFEVVSKLIEI